MSGNRGPVSRSRQIELSIWRRDGRDVISPQIEAIANSSEVGARVAAHLYGFLIEVQGLGERNTASSRRTGFPILCFQAPLAVGGRRVRLYASTIGENGLVSAIGFVADRDNLLHDKKAIIRTSIWAARCKRDRGRPWVVDFKDYLDAHPCQDRDIRWMIDLRERALRAYNGRNPIL